MWSFDLWQIFWVCLYFAFTERSEVKENNGIHGSWKFYIVQNGQKNMQWKLDRFKRCATSCNIESKRETSDNGDIYFIVIKKYTSIHNARLENTAEKKSYFITPYGLTFGHFLLQQPWWETLNSTFSCQAFIPLPRNTWILLMTKPWEHLTNRRWLATLLENWLTVTQESTRRPSWPASIDERRHACPLRRTRHCYSAAGKLFSFDLGVLDHFPCAEDSVGCQYPAN